MLRWILFASFSLEERRGVFAFHWVGFKLHGWRELFVLGAVGNTPIVGNRRPASEVTHVPVAIMTVYTNLVLICVFVNSVLEALGCVVS